MFKPIGHWQIIANRYQGLLVLWSNNNTYGGMIRFENNTSWEVLKNISYDSQTNRISFTRNTQEYTGLGKINGFTGKFREGRNSYLWNALQIDSPLSKIQSTDPNVKHIDSRIHSPISQKILVLVEERIISSMLSTFNGGNSVLARYLDDLNREGFEVHMYSYDVRSSESGLQEHHHHPTEVLRLYKYIRDFYFASNCLINGVVLIGDFPAAGTCNFYDEQKNNSIEQHELDYFCVDVMLSDPYGYWEWLPLAPMIPAGSSEMTRLPYDENRHPGGMLYPRDQWSAPGFVHTRQSEVHHSQRDSRKYGSEPKFWIGRITAAQSAWITGPNGWEYSFDEEIRQLVDYFDRNHFHRTNRRNGRGYIFIEKDWAGGWRNQKDKMARILNQNNIVVNADSPDFNINNKASISNYFESFRQDYLVCEYIMHSDWLNHSFSSESGQDTFPNNFPNSFRTTGSNYLVNIPKNTVKSIHLIANPNKSNLPRFYLLGGCDVGAILFRPKYMDQEQLSPATKLNRQYGAHVLGVSYLMHANGLAVLAHNVTNPPSDYTQLYEEWRNGKSFGDAVLSLMNQENNSRLPHYRNVIFGDPTLRLSY